MRENMAPICYRVVRPWRSVFREPVAASTHRLYQVLMAGWRQCRAQAADMNIHGTLFNEDVVSPDKIEQLGARINSLLVGHEKMQQPKFGRPHRSAFASPVTLCDGRVEPQAMIVDHILRQFRRASAKYRFDARFQFAQRKRLGDVIVGAGFEALEFVLFLALGGEQDDGQRSGS